MIRYYNTFKLVWLSCFLVLTTGLSFRKDSRSTTSTDALHSCAKLKCFESGLNITKLTLYTQLSRQDGTLVRQPVLSVNSDNPRVNRVTSDVKMYGTWDTRSVYGSIQLTDASVCDLVTYICEIRMQDSSGEEWVTSGQLGKLGLNGINGDNEQNTTVMEKLEELQRQQELNKKLLEHAVKHAENRIVDELKHLEENIVKRGNDSNVQNCTETQTITSREISSLGMEGINKLIDFFENNKDSLTTNDADKLSKGNDTTVESCSCNKPPEMGHVPIQHECKKRDGFNLSLQKYQLIVSPTNVPLYLCDAQTDGGGWIIIQRRIVGDVDFTQNWEIYKQGFGFFNSDYYLGNEAIHQLTKNGSYELRIDMKYKSDVIKYANYDSFSLDGEDAFYTLKLGKYSGTAGDSMAYHNGMKFSTHDKDNDANSGKCAVTYPAGWWFKSCMLSNLNGLWKNNKSKGLYWKQISTKISLDFAEMKIRPK